MEHAIVLWVSTMLLLIFVTYWIHIFVGLFRAVANELNEKSKVNHYFEDYLQWNRNAFQRMSSDWVNINAKFRWKWLTPLMLACREEDEETVVFLIKKGATINLSSSVWTPLIESIEHIGLLRILLEAWADPNLAESTRGITPLIVASASGYLEVTKLLLEAWANPNILAKSWLSPLVAVLMYQKQNPGEFESGNELLKLLLNNGADPTVWVGWMQTLTSDSSVTTVADFLIKTGRASFVFLQENGAWRTVLRKLN